MTIRRNLRLVRGALLGLTIIIAGSACQSTRPDGGNGGDRRPSGEPSVAAKHQGAARLKQEKPSHQSLGSADLDPHTVKPLATIGGVSVKVTSPFHAVLFEGGMAVDADGSPHAYHPKPDDDKGLDNLADAGHPGNWWGIATDNGKGSGTPVVQGSGDPAPGFYVSTTALEDPNYSRTDPRNYVNASTIPFIVLPDRNQLGARLGDIAAVVNFSNGKVAYAIAADLGPADQLGEGSVALAKALGINPSARSGGTGAGIGYCLFPNSGNQRPQSLSKINQIGAELFNDFGGVAELRKHLGQ